MAGWPATPSVTSLDLNAGGLVLPAPWVKVENLLDLELPTGQRGENLTISGVTGTRPKRHVYDESEWELRLIVRGDVLHDGTTPANSRVGRATNVAYLKAQTAPVATAPYTRAAVFTLETGATVTGAVQTVLRTNDAAARWGRYTLTVRLPAGDWTP